MRRAYPTDFQIDPGPPAGPGLNVTVPGWTHWQAGGSEYDSGPSDSATLSRDALTRRRAFRHAAACALGPTPGSSGSEAGSASERATETRRTGLGGLGPGLRTAGPAPGGSMVTATVTGTPSLAREMLRQSRFFIAVLAPAPGPGGGTAESTGYEFLRLAKFSLCSTNTQRLRK